MKPLTFVFSHDHIFAGVKQEASQYAVRKTDSAGNPLFDELVLDEAYLPKFRELFFDARAKVMPAVSAYMKEEPRCPEYFETQDFSRNRDFTLLLTLPDDFMTAMAQPFTHKVKQFIVSYILYRWLETKAHKDAFIYRQRAEEVLPEAKALLERRTCPIRRNHRLF